MTHLYLIRHGQAISAVEDTIADTGLSPLGIRQAERLRDRLAASHEIAADVLIASTFLRAKETAEIVAPALGLPIIFDDDLQEWRDGLTGDNSASVEEYLTEFNATPLEQQPFFRTIPASETWVEFALRASTTLNRITQEYAGKTIVIVCHGGIIDCSFIFFLGLSSLFFPRALFSTHNTSITHWFRGTYADLPESWILEHYNDTMHLRDLDSEVKIPWRQIAAHPVLGRRRSFVPVEAQQAE
jgi:2,3-bisphosphoglycerate-dependent phosphoglycerate mutase